ncbi:hypothetical protein [Mongoliitalea daihaiensis]|uniref:hypothetical protein n=1 Tax=Mongoliitalea daihaiensis TaxID=2782006 RepID=UPI001F1CE653|nr:hypothetical protein [Mongoliitalea daihaiensis]UJP65535.1 hypothetical protein IPZ59_02595 [Mongoliitalea daihaiensis]
MQLMRAEDKRKILEAYLDKTIDKEEMKFLFDHGIIVPPIQWVDSKEKINDKKRELLSRVFGMTFPKIEWI